MKFEVNEREKTFLKLAKTKNKNSVLLNPIQYFQMLFNAVKYT